MAILVNRRVTVVQQRVRVALDDASRKLGPRGLNFQLKQGMLWNGAGTNMWIEIQVAPLVQARCPRGNASAHRGKPTCVAALPVVGRCRW